MSEANKSDSKAGLEGVPDFGAAVAAIFEMENLINKLIILGIEYQANNIQPERFAKRTHELLVEYQQRMYIDGTS